KGLTKSDKSRSFHLYFDTLNHCKKDSLFSNLMAIRVLYVKRFEYDMLDKIIEQTKTTTPIVVINKLLSDFKGMTATQLESYDVICLPINNNGVTANGEPDLSSTNVDNIKTFIEDGGGVLWTHANLDRNLNDVDALVPAGMIDSGVGLIGPYNRARIINNHKILHSPFEIGYPGKIFSTMPTHTDGGSKTTAEIIIQFDAEAPANNNYYLAVNEYNSGRVAVSAIGHSMMNEMGTLNGLPKLTESQLLVNTIYWLANNEPVPLGFNMGSKDEKPEMILEVDQNSSITYFLSNFIPDQFNHERDDIHSNEALAWSISGVSVELFTATIINQTNSSERDRIEIVAQPNKWGESNITLTLKDGDALIDKQDVTVKILFVDYPPVILSSLPLTFEAEEDHKTYYNLTAFEWDDDETHEGLIWSLDGFDESLFSVFIDPRNDEMTGIPLPDAFGTTTAVLSLSETDGKYSTREVTIVINEINDPPKITPAIDDTLKNWYDPDLHYRVRLNISKAGSKPEPALVSLNMTQLVKNAGIDYAGDFMESSIRVIEYDIDGNIIGEVPSEFIGQVKNLVTNPSFEKDDSTNFNFGDSSSDNLYPNGWSGFLNSYNQLDSYRFNTGNSSWKFTPPDFPAEVGPESKSIKVNPDLNYTFSGWAYAWSLQGDAIEARIDFYDKNGTKLAPATNPKLTWGTGSYTWNQKQITFKPSDYIADVSSAVITLYYETLTGGLGELYFDDICLVEGADSEYNKAINAAVTIEWVMPGGPGTKYYEIYFDTEDNDIVPEQNYPFQKFSHDISGCKGLSDSYWLKSDHSINDTAITMSSNLFTYDVKFENEKLGWQKMTGVFEQKLNSPFVMDHPFVKLDGVEFGKKYDQSSKYMVQFFDWRSNSWRNWKEGGGVGGFAEPDWTDPRFQLIFKWRYIFDNGSIDKIPKVLITYMMTSYDPMIRINYSLINDSNDTDPHTLTIPFLLNQEKQFCQFYSEKDLDFIEKDADFEYTGLAGDMYKFDSSGYTFKEKGGNTQTGIADTITNNLLVFYSKTA
ncbi:hypothetical protein KAJ27_03820, partial [bacterium]|nr:hypothetical protein [bacterium]